MQEARHSDVAAEDSTRKSGVRERIASALLEVLMLTDDQLSDNQRAFTGDMLTALVPFLSDEFLMDMSDRVASRNAPALTLMRALLLKRIEIARPILERQSAIPDGLLIEAANISPEHQRAVAGRFRISERVADALFDDGSQALRVAMLMRDEVPLAPHRVSWLVEQSRTEPSLRLPLLNRQELQPSHGFTMFWWLDPNQRMRAFSRFNVSREPIQDMLAPLYLEVFTDDESDPVARGVLSLCDRRHRPRNSCGQVVPMPAVEQMLRAVRANPAGELCATTGLLAGISLSTTRKVMNDEGGEPFSVLCKSLGVARSHFIQIMNDADERRPEGAKGPQFSQQRREELMVVFDMISRDYARTILRYWDWRDAMDALTAADSGEKRLSLA